jgi:hypothetical protein
MKALRAVLVVLAVMTVLASCTSSKAKKEEAPAPAVPMVAAASYGAVCNGSSAQAPHATSGPNGSVDYVGIQAAVNAAEKQGAGTKVLIPPGKCKLNQAINLKGATPVVLAGTTGNNGAPLTTLTDTVNPQSEGGDLQITTDKTVVEDLVLDQSSYGGTIYLKANNTTLQRLTVLGGPAYFAIFAVGIKSGTKATGNKLLNSNVTSLINRLVLTPSSKQACDDGLSWSNQTNSTISKLIFTGTRLALYQDSATKVMGFTYYPGPQTCGTDGFYITQPSMGITMTNLTMHGSAGIVSNGGRTNGISTNVTITNETVLAPEAGDGFSLNVASHGLLIRNVNGVKISNSTFNSGQQANSSISIQPSTSAKGVAVSNTTVQRVSFQGAKATSSTPDSSSTSTFTNDTYPAFNYAVPTTDTFWNFSGAPAKFTITGGTFNNAQPSHVPYMGLFKGNNTTFSVTNLAGYSGPATQTITTTK